MSSFDTHARWQPVTQSARSRRSYGKMEDCEQSNSTLAKVYMTELSRPRGRDPIAWSWLPIT